MNYKISVIKNFSAAHALRGYKGRCEHLHGHNWKIRAALVGKKLDSVGMLTDFTELRSVLARIIEKLDHKYLNEVSPFDKLNPTAELIAAHIFNSLKKFVPVGIKVAEVEVWESEGSSATVTE